MSDLAAELIDAEREGWKALVSGRGGEHYRRHLAPNALMAFGFGVMSRQEAINAMEAAPPWSSFDLANPQVVELSTDSGVVVYRVNAQRPGEPPYAAIVSSTFIRGDGRWLLFSSRLLDSGSVDGVTLMGTVPASRSMPIRAPPPRDGLTTSISADPALLALSCERRKSRTVARREERAEAYFPCERRLLRWIQSAMREQLPNASDRLKISRAHF